MKIWHQVVSTDDINKNNMNSMVSHCGIEITELTSDSLTGVMPADERTFQPFGIVHGGANCVLAETLGSIAANLTCNPKTHHAVGLSITTNHVKAVRNGMIKGIAVANHLGRSTQVWEIRTFNNGDQLTSVTSLTMAIVPRLK